MKKLIIATTLSLVTAVGAMADINLLQGAYSHPLGSINSTEDFYSVWQCRRPNGMPEETTMLPNSVFNQVTTATANGNPAYYKGNTIEESTGITFLPANAESSVFTDGMPLIIMDFPNQTGYADMSYSYALSPVPEAGTYTLSGAVACSAIGSVANGQLLKLKQVVFVGNTDPAVPMQSMKIAQGETGAFIEVTNVDGKILPCTWVSASTASNQAYAFSKTIELKPEHKYLTVYAPATTLFLGKLTLTGEMGSVIGISENSTEGKVEYFDLYGHRLADLPESGIYIRKCGNRVEKVIK